MRQEQLPPPPPLAQLRKHHCWLWLNCPHRQCLRRAPMALAPLIIRWGPDASSDVLRQRARCSRCGHKGATLQMPSWAGSEVGLAAFPAERLR